ncbi:MAG: hypothetical protein ABFD82_04420 [Syntrophaceae bacterium]
MKVAIDEIIPCECKECQEVTVLFSIAGKSYYAFGTKDDFISGEVAEVDFDYLEGNISWEERFSKNSKKEKSLTRTGNWSYDGLGIIISINPVISDFGDIKLDLGYFTHDPHVIGEHIYERIDRLNIFPKRNLR